MFILVKKTLRYRVCIAVSKNRTAPKLNQGIVCGGVTVLPSEQLMDGVVPIGLYE